MSLNRCPRCGENLEKSSGSPFRDAARFVQEKLGIKMSKMSTIVIPEGIKMFASFVGSFIFLFLCFAIWDFNVLKFGFKMGITFASAGMVIFFAGLGFWRLGSIK